mmetsp:Transcript_1308/g.2215  ORF Transcript_1308/g.2215 Transcript_1308/m.2215 type:complete len:619 (+) Transcript_1308:69-1925(+)
MVRQVDAKLKGVIQLQKGSKVQVQGLKNQKELNGLCGHLLQFDAVKLRWGVELPGGKKILLKMDNLIPVDADVLPATYNKSTGMPEPVEPTEEANKPQEIGANGDGAPEDQASAPATADVEAAAPEDVSVPAAEIVATTSPVLTSESADAGEAASQNISEAPNEDAREAPAPLTDEEWPVLPTSKETMAKMQSGCWFDGGSAAKRFTEQLIANDSTLKSICLVPPKRFNDEDAEQICDALEANTFCHEMLASGHSLSEASCKRIAHMLQTNTTLQTLSVGDSSLGAAARILFEGLAHNLSLTALDMESKGLTSEACIALADALNRRQDKKAAPMASLRLSRNPAISTAFSNLLEAPAPRVLQLCECALGAKHGESIGQWIARGVTDLDLRDNSAFGSDGVEKLMEAILKPKDLQPPALRSLRLDGCAIGDDGLEVIADAFARGLAVEDLFVERCEIMLPGCEMLSKALSAQQLRTLSVRANVIGDEGCSLLTRCAQRLDLSSTSLTGQVLSALGEQPLLSLELFSNPTLGPSVSTWCAALASEQWQRLEYLDLGGCALQDEGFLCLVTLLLERPSLMPALTCLCLGANDVKEDEAKSDLVERLSVAREGRLKVIWQNA